MAIFLGQHFEVRLDDKSRIKLPAALLNKIPTGERNSFMVKMGFETHLYLYLMSEWLKIAEEIGKLNQYVKKNRDFIRIFYKYSSEVVLDKSGRLLLPKNLLEKAKIEKDIVLFAHDNLVEIWDRNIYNTIVDDESVDPAELAESVMGKINNITPDD